MLDRSLAKIALMVAYADSETLIFELDRGGNRLTDFLIAQDLGAAWHEATSHPALAHAHRAAAASYMLQTTALSELDEKFNTAGIEYVVMKGACNREILYTDPSVRLCADIDILVHPRDRVKCASLLMSCGFKLALNADIVSHEATLSRGSVDIDLHWDVMRPGRARESLSDSVLSRRVKKDGFWAPNNQDALFLLLVHPAFAKHVSGPEMGLPRIVDILRWFLKMPVNQTEILDMFAENGVNTAAWAVLQWVNLLAARQEVEELINPLASALQPGPIRAKFIRSWLETDMAYRFRDVNVLRLALFSVFLHDRPSDFGRFVSAFARAMKNRKEDLASFDELSPKVSS